MSSSQPDPEKVTPSEAGGGQVQQDAPAPSTTAAVTAESPIPEGTAPGSEDGSKGNPEKGGEKADDKADDKVTPTVSARPEREATFKDYVRVFSYAKKFDYVLMVAAAIASIGAGTVSDWGFELSFFLSFFFFLLTFYLSSIVVSAQIWLTLPL